MEKVAVITSGYFPVPATLGGAVEALEENLIVQNEIKGRIRLFVFSCYDSKAKKIASNYKNTTVIFIKMPLAIKYADKAIYFFVKNIFRKKKSLSYRYIMQRLYFLRRTAQYLRDNNYDRVILENHSSLFLSLKYYNNFKKYKGRYYYHLHNVVNNDYGCRSIMSNCERVIGVSNYINSTLKDFLGREDNNKYCVLRNRINRDSFFASLSESEKKVVRKRYGLEKTDKVVLFTGRLSEEKGVRELLTAFKNVNNLNAKLLVAGGYYFGSGMKSPFEEEMKKLVVDIKERIIFTGFINYKEIPKLYAIADLVVIPSMWDDPAPLTVIEALTAGKALITTNSGGIPEYAEGMAIILNRNNQIINNLAESIQRVLNDEKERIIMEKKALLGTKDWTSEAYYNDFCEKIR